MSKKTIEKNLRRVLLDDESFALALYEYELEEHIEEYVRSKRADGDNYFFAITEHTHDVAMLLIDKGDKIHVNEKARALLKKLWRDAYRENLQILIPQMADELNAGYLFVAGVKVSAETGQRNRIRN
jgi:vacuolar-type H+-ATPase subunit E/Vma4